MTSFQTTLTPNKRASARFIARVRRSLQQAFAEEAGKRQLSQSDVARALGVNRSVISRELRGHKDITLGRLAELSWALGRVPTFTLPEAQPQAVQGSNFFKVTGPVQSVTINATASNSAAATTVNSVTVVTAGGTVNASRATGGFIDPRLGNLDPAHINSPLVASSVRQNG